MKISQINLNTDLPKVQEVANLAFSATPDSLLEEWFSFEEMQRMIELERGVCLKAEDDNGKVLGMIYAQQENPINGKEGLDKWVIVIAAVHPDAKGQGVGSELLKGIENVARERKVSKMFVYTNKDDNEVINFYHKNGYEDAGWIKAYQYGENNSAVFLLKYLK